MSCDLERLIESVITDISCYGDLGCTVSHVLESLGTFYKDAAQLQNDGSSQTPDSISTETNQLLWSTAWDWLRERKDIYVGVNRKWNQLSLSDILAVPEADSQEASTAASSGTHTNVSASGGDGTQAKDHPKGFTRTGLPRKRPRIYVSEDRMWESIAGHAPDYRRVPRLEWMALVGIASTKRQGILQGDLGRLVDQDKRSLPKRTDALAEKGYISKRTTLVRGTKTSKMWLTRFAPELPTDPTKAVDGIPSDDMPHEKLARDLEPVAWRARWTGDSVDYISLAKTIMAIVKAYRIIRYHDLRCKLGILGLRWQMKVAAKTCRFFVQTGAIQYVGATLSGKLFKDCLKFDHDLTHEDWAAYLATGKQKSSLSLSTGFADTDIYAADGIGPSGSAANTASPSPTSSPHHSTEKKRITSRAMWIPDKPLTNTVFDNISAAGTSGLSNKQIGDSTLGSSFRRYLSSISATLAISTLQPEYLNHFQVHKEMHRRGKSQQYRYFPPKWNRNPGSVLAKGNEDFTYEQCVTDVVNGKELEKKLDSLLAVPELLPDSTRIMGGLTALAQGIARGATSGILKRKVDVFDSPRVSQSCGSGSRRAKRARVSKAVYGEVSETDGFSSRASDDLHIAPSPRTSTRRSTRTRQLATAEIGSLVVRFKVDPTALSQILRAGTNNTGDEMASEHRLASTVDEASGHVAPPRGATLDMASVKDILPEDKTNNKALVSTDVMENDESIVVAHGEPSKDAGVQSAQVVDEDLADDLPVKRGGRGKKKGSQSSSRRVRPRVFKCEKCGGTWKNDVGLKYHLEKSQTPCNPSYIPPTPGPVGRPDSVSRLSKSATQSLTPRKTRSRQTVSATSGGVQDPFVVTTEQSQDQAGSATGLANTNGSMLNDGAPDRDRSMRPRRANASSERFGIRNRTAGPRLASKSASTLRPPGSSMKAFTSGLINDPAGSMRDMPAEHAPVQAAFKRPWLEENPKLSNPNNAPTDHHGKSVARAAEANELSSSTPLKGRCSVGQEDVALDPAEQGLLQDGINTSTAPGCSASEPLLVEAVRASINRNGAPSDSESDPMERTLMHILRANGGAFPGGRSVWYAVIAIWEIAFPTEPVPAHQDYKDALTRLAKRKQIVVSTHAFKDGRGMMANYQLLRIPGVEASSPAGATMKANIIAAHPKPYTPPGFTPKAGLPEDEIHDAQPVFSSRRKLVQGIEVLDAPFYANKAANERPLSSHEGNSQFPRKRKRRMVTREQITHAEDESPDSTRRRDIFRLFIDGNEGESDGPGASGPSGDGTGCFANRIVFLNPNTYLGQDVPEDVRRALLPDHPAPGPTYLAPSVGGGVTSDLNVSFTETDVVVGSNGTWPNPNNSIFEAEYRSLTIQGWMPDSRWFLRQNLPQNLTEMVKWRGRPRARFPSSRQYSEFAEQVNACFDWELSTEGMMLMLAESIAPDYIFINLGIDDLPGEWDCPPLEWSTANQLSPSALFDMRISEQGTTATDHLWGGDLGRQKRRKRRQKQAGIDAKELVIGIDLKIRSLTTLPRDTDLRDGSKRNSGLDETNETVLIAAFVATRTLLGGADRIIEWGLMMTLFPDMALSAMRRFWSKARKDRRTFINQLTERFQVRFISAYENSEFPPIDFDNYVDYDWARLIKWTAGLIEDSVELPASKAALDHGYALASAWADVDNWRDDYYNFQMSVFNRFEAVTSRPATSFVDKSDEAAQEQSTEDLVTAMSWLRSLCYTPRDKYAPHDIRKKMASIAGGDEERIQTLLEQAVETLQGQGVITDSKLKALEGRPYRLTETFLPRFMKWTHEVKFLDAARFKSRLDGSFRRGEKIRIPYVLKDGEVMAMMNLQASRRISVNTVDVPSIPLGFEPGNYESRKYPKSYYNFRLEIAPTNDYVYDEDLDIIQQARSNKPPQENQNRAIPLWSDFFGELDLERWSQVLGAVAFVISTRGPLDVPSVCAVLKPYLQEFEVQMVFDWGRRNGVLKEMAHGTHCTVGEWWWLLVGRQRGVAV